jgi:hypothetical protein
VHNYRKFVASTSVYTESDRYTTEALAAYFRYFVTHWLQVYAANPLADYTSIMKRIPPLLLRLQRDHTVHSRVFLQGKMISAPDSKRSEDSQERCFQDLMVEKGLSLPQRFAGFRKQEVRLMPCRCVWAIPWLYILLTRAVAAVSVVRWSGAADVVQTNTIGR